MKSDNLIVSFLVFFLSIFNGIAETKIIPFDISYANNIAVSANDSLVININYKSMPTSGSFGWDNGIYWFKLKLPKTEIENTIVYFPTHNISKLELYKLDNKQLTYISSHGNMATDIGIKYRFPAFKIKDNTKTYYFKANFKKEANFPIKVISETNFYSEALQRQSLNFFYYGFCLIAVLVNLFFYLKFRKKTFIYYACFLALVIVNIMHIDGMFSSVLRNSDFLNYLDPLIHLLEEVCIILFSISFLELDKRNPKFSKTIFIAPVTVTICYLAYLITGNFKLHVIGDLISIPAFGILWLFGVYYIKQLPYAKFYVLGYILLLPTGSYYFIGYSTGLWAVDGDLIFVKISSALDVLIFTYAISYRMKVKLHQVNTKLDIKEISTINNLLDQNKYINQIKTPLSSTYRKFEVKNRKQPQNILKEELITSLNQTFNLKEDSKYINEKYELLHKGFIKTLKETYPMLSVTDVKMCMLIKLDMSNKEIGLLLNIQPRSIVQANYRMKKKMKLPSEMSISEHIASL